VKHERSGQTGVQIFDGKKHPSRSRPDIMPVPHLMVNPASKTKRPPPEGEGRKLNCRKNYFLLRIDAALFDRVSNSVNCQHIGGNPVVYVMCLRIANDVLERRHHDFL